jgi:hypothetical protein
LLLFVVVLLVVDFYTVAGVVVDTFNLRVFSLGGHSSFRLFFSEISKIDGLTQNPSFPARGASCVISCINGRGQISIPWYRIGYLIGYFEIQTKANTKLKTENTILLVL